jgi:hypothetical protein
MTGDHPALRAAAAPARRESMPPIVRSQIDPATLAAGETPRRVAEAAGRPSCARGFCRDRPALSRRAGERARQPLGAQPVRQEERYESVIVHAVDTVFGAELRPSWARRLYETGYFFAVTAGGARRAGGRRGRGIGGRTAPSQIPSVPIWSAQQPAFFFKLALEQGKARSHRSCSPAAGAPNVWQNRNS